MIYNWLTEEQTHSIVPYDNYSLEKPDPETFLDEATKAIRTEKYQLLLQLLKSNLQHLEDFTISLVKSEYKKLDSVCGLIGKTADNNWIAILPTVPQRLSFPHWIDYSPLTETTVQSSEENTSRLQTDIEYILRELQPLKLAICNVAGYGYTYDYQLVQAIYSTKEAAFTQIMLKLKVLEMKQFEYFFLITINMIILMIVEEKISNY